MWEVRIRWRLGFMERLVGYSWILLFLSYGMFCLVQENTCSVRFAYTEVGCLSSVFDVCSGRV